jgi:hypothetical protein
MLQNPSVPLTIHEVCPGDEFLRDELLRLFAEIFPKYKRYMPQIQKSIDLGKALNPKVEPHHWVVEFNGQLVGFTLFNYLIEGNFGFGRYIGVDPNCRKSGIGMQIVHQTLEQIRIDAKYYKKPNPIGFCAEVESPSVTDDTQEIRLRGRRLDYFIFKCGALELNVDYLEPPYIRGTMNNGEYIEASPTPMHLILFPDQPRDNIDIETTQMMVKNVYSDHYLFTSEQEFIKTVMDSVGKATNLYYPGVEK